MTVLPVPVKDVLREPIAEQAVARMWARIEAGERSTRRWRPRAALAVAFALAGAGIVVAVVLASSSGRGETPRGPIALAGGEAWQAMRPTADKTVALDDGSLLALAANAEVEPVANTATEVVVRQPRGAVVYDVAPHTRHWTIDCGVVAVDVVGTRFRVDHDARRVRVDVERGLVVVRGRGVPHGAVRLSPGMHVEVATDDAPAAPAPAAPATALEAPLVPSPVPPPPRTWRDLAAHGANAEAYAKLGRGGVAATARTASVEELFTLADVARLSGHAGEAVDPLQRIVHHHATDPRAPLAALTLGRIELRSLDAPAAAVRALEVAIARGLPADLGEDAGALHVEALARAGQADAARAAYARFAAQFPGSARLRELPAWLHGR